MSFQGGVCADRSRFCRRLTRIAGCGLLVCGLAAVRTPTSVAAAEGSELTRVTIDAEPGAWGYKDPGFQLTSDEVEVTRSFSGGVAVTATHDMQEIVMVFRPASGDPLLSVGTYETVRDVDGDGAGPAMSVRAAVAGCDGLQGRFVVEDISFGDDDQPITFAARFEQSCGTPATSVFGAISYRSTAPFRARTLSSDVLDFGRTSPGHVRNLKETITNQGPSPLTFAATFGVDGANASEFTVQTNGCVSPLAAGQSCDIDLRFSPQGSGLRNAALVFFDDLASQAGTGRHVALVGVAEDLEGEFTPLNPARIVDTRDGTGGFAGPLGAGDTISVHITGAGGVPAGNVEAVVLNLTATEPTVATYLTAWPTGVARPGNSNLNVVAGSTRANLVTVAVGDGGRVDLYNYAGQVHAVIDVVGYYADPEGTPGTLFHPVGPFRLIDTRGVDGEPAAALGAGEVRAVRVTGQAGVPYVGVGAVVMNVTATEPTAPGFLTVYPEDQARPTASNLNFVAKQTIPNLVVVRLPPSGIINIFNLTGSTHVIADVVGYYDNLTTSLVYNESSSTAGRFHPVVPARILDTRTANDPIAADEYGVLSIIDTAVAPKVIAVILNVTVTEPTRAGYLTLFSDDDCYIPVASNLNFVPGDTVANLVVVPVSTGSSECASGDPGSVDVYNYSGTTHVVVDIFGYFTTE